MQGLAEAHSFFPEINENGFVSQNGIFLFTEEQKKSFTGKHQENVSKMLEFLFSDGSLPAMEKELLRSILLKRNIEIIEVLGEQLQLILHNIKEQAERSKDPEFKIQAQIMVGNIIALLPYFSPEYFRSKELAIPKFDVSQLRWRNVVYRITCSPMELPSLFWNKFLGKGIDIVELEPLNESEREPAIRVFQGTTYPAGKGMWMTLLADVTPFSSVGEIFFLCEDSIKKSLDASGRPLELYGQSLGGALAMLVAAKWSERVEKAVVFSSPKLLSKTLKRLQAKNAFQGKGSFPKVGLFIQEGDLVPMAGDALPNQTEIFSLSKEKEVAGNFFKRKFFSHAQCFAGLKGVKIKRIDVKDIEKWSLTGIIHYILSPFLFAFLFLIFSLWRILCTLFYTFPIEIYHRFTQPCLI